MPKTIKIYTDGSCNYADGSGGVGCVLTMEGAPKKEIKRGFQNTKTGRMEIMAVICALMALKRPCSVLIACDSEYVVNSIQRGWAKEWKRNGWRKPSGAGEIRINADLWEIVLQLCEVHQVTMQWVKGKTGDHPDHDQCHELANEARRNGPWIIDDEDFKLDLLKGPFMACDIFASTPKPAGKESPFKKLKEKLLTQQAVA